jgi:hypothetical protein
LILYDHLSADIPSNEDSAFLEAKSEMH